MNLHQAAVSKKITEMTRSTECGPSFSFEFIPNESENLQNEIEALLELNPCFASVTWGAGRLGCRDEQSLSLSSLIQNKNRVACLHLNTIGMTPEKVRTILQKADELGIRNLFVVRGDRPTLVQKCLSGGSSRLDNCTSLEENDKPYFLYASDLVSFIKEMYGNRFCIGVGAYPEKHPESRSKEEDNKYLKEKVNKGADFIITQYFFNSNNYVSWVKELRDNKVTVPIFPLVMLIENYEVFERIQNLTKVDFPKSLKCKFEAVKSNPTATMELGVKIASDIIHDLKLKLDPKELNNIHLSTLNNYAITKRIVT